MHDPYSVIRDFKIGKITITLWHKDPCKDGTDDSCGRFIRARHCDQAVLEKIKKEFEFNFKHNYWFYPNSAQIFSTQGTLQLMYEKALWIIYNGNRKKIDRFFRNNLHKIYNLAENPTDCIGEYITNKWGYEGNHLYHERLFLAAVIYADIMRKTRKWYQNPCWHFHHWRFSIVGFKVSKKEYANVSVK